jgi:hypothetical protein
MAKVCVPCEIASKAAAMNGTVDQKISAAALTGIIVGMQCDRKKVLAGLCIHHRNVALTYAALMPTSKVVPS